MDTQHPPLPTCKKCGSKNFQLFTVVVEIVDFTGEFYEDHRKIGIPISAIDEASVGADTLTYAGSITAACSKCGKEIDWSQRADFNNVIDNFAYDIVGQREIDDTIRESLEDWLQFIDDDRPMTS